MQRFHHELAGTWASAGTADPFPPGLLLTGVSDGTSLTWLYLRHMAWMSWSRWASSRGSGMAAQTVPVHGFHPGHWPAAAPGWWCYRNGVYVARLNTKAIRLLNAEPQPVHQWLESLGVNVTFKVITLWMCCTFEPWQPETIRKPPQIIPYGPFSGTSTGFPVKG